MYKSDYDSVMREIFRVVETRISGSSREDDAYEHLSAAEVAGIVDYVCRGHGLRLGDTLIRKLCHFVEQEFFGYGPLEEVLDNPAVTEVMVNGAQEVWVEVEGRIVPAPTHFLDDDHIRKFIRLIASGDHRTCDTSHPLCDCMLNAPGRSFDRSRVNLTLPPISLRHPTITVRKFPERPLGIDDMLRLGTLDNRMAEVLEACVRGRLNVLVIGGTGSGKTSMLNVLSEFIPDDQRIITIEDTAELRLSKPNLITMQARRANAEGVGEVSIREIFQNALRQRPDRIIVGECRGGEAIDMLEAMSTGHDGSLTTIHANDARESILRMDVLASMDGMHLPIETINEHFALAVDLIVSTRRFYDGSRKVSEVVEVGNYNHESGVVSMSPLLQFLPQGSFRRADGTVELSGSFEATGACLSPSHTDRLLSNGVQIDPAWFVRSAR